LVWGLAFFVVTHVVALATMALVLGPGMDPGAAPVDVRMAWIASHAAAWRWGWLPWQLSALSDLWVCLALVLVARANADAVAVRLAFGALVLDLVGVAPEQWAELQLVTSFLDIRDPDAWREAWALYAWLTGVWANFAYTAMTALWTLAARNLLGRVTTHVAFEAAIVLGFVVSGALTWLATSSSTDERVARWFALSTAANGLAFPALVLWTAVFAWRLRSAR
jgi:hypothetical protein